MPNAIECVTESGQPQTQPNAVVLTRDDLRASASFFAAIGLMVSSQPTQTNVSLGCKGLELRIQRAAGDAEPPRHLYFSVDDMQPVVAAVQACGGVVVPDGDLTPRLCYVHLGDRSGRRVVVAENLIAPKIPTPSGMFPGPAPVTVDFTNARFPRVAAPASGEGFPGIIVSGSTPRGVAPTSRNASDFVWPYQSHIGAIYVAAGHAAICYPVRMLMLVLLFASAGPVSTYHVRYVLEVCASFAIGGALFCYTGRIRGRRNPRLRPRAAFSIGIVCDIAVFFASFCMYVPDPSRSLIIGYCVTFLGGTFGGAASYLVCMLSTATSPPNRRFRVAAMICLIALPLTVLGYAAAFVIPYNFPAWRSARGLWRLLDNGVSVWSLYYIVVAAWFQWAAKRELRPRDE